MLVTPCTLLWPRTGILSNEIHLNLNLSVCLSVTYSYSKVGFYADLTHKIKLLWKRRKWINEWIRWVSEDNAFESRIHGQTDRQTEACSKNTTQGPKGAKFLSKKNKPRASYYLFSKHLKKSNCIDLKPITTCLQTDRQTGRQVLAPIITCCGPTSIIEHFFFSL